MTENRKASIEESEVNYIDCRIIDREYRISTFLSVGDCSDIESYLESGEREYRKEVAKLFWNKVICDDSERPSLESVIDLPDDCLQRMLFGMLQSDEKLFATYQGLADIEDLYYRFMLAINRYMEELYLDIADSLKDSLVEAIKAIDIDYEKVGKTVVDVANGFTSLCTYISGKIKSFEEGYRRFEETYGKTLGKLIESLGHASERFELPGFSEAERKEILASYAKWGSYGWTPPMSIQFNQMYTAPQSQEQADEKMLRYCTDAEMEELFKDTLDHPLAVRSDVEEAVFSYKNHQYKACVLILFALIDGLLISYQKEEDRDPKTHRRSSGCNAFNKLLKRFDTEHPDTYVVKLFVCQSIASCLQAFFANGKDFVEEPDVINRNYIGHGMSKRPVEKIDCIKVFLLYRHVLHFLKTL